MKCKYCEYFIQNYNDNNLSIEENVEFEKHLTSCQHCKNIVMFDKAFLSYVKQDEPLEKVPAEIIMNAIDQSKYSSKKYKMLSLIRKLNLSFKVAIPLIAASLLITLVLSNSAITKPMVNVAMNILNKSEKLNTQAIHEIHIEKIAGTNANLVGTTLIDKLNNDGLGVSPWIVSHAHDEKIFFRNYASLIGYKNGNISLIADLKILGADHIQGSVISEFKFNRSGDFVVIGNSSYEMDLSDQYQSPIYILDTTTGDYFIIEETNYANISDSWSFNGNYYAFVNKNKTSNLLLFDTSKKKFFEILNPGLFIERVFVTDEGTVSFYSDKNIYFLNEKTYEIEKKVEVEFKPIFIDGKNYTALNFEDNSLIKHSFEKNDIVSTEISSSLNDKLFIKDYRFLVFESFDNIKIYDLKEKCLNIFPVDNLHGGYTISSNGQNLLDIYNTTIIYSANGNKELLDIPYADIYSSNWISDSKIAFISLIDKNEYTGVLDTKAGEFKITTFDVISMEKKIIYNSLNPAQGVVSEDLSYFYDLIKLGSYNDAIQLRDNYRHPQNIIFTDDEKMILPQSKVVSILGKTVARQNRFVDIDKDKIYELINAIENSTIIDEESIKRWFPDTLDAYAQIILQDTEEKYIELSIGLDSKFNHGMVIKYQDRGSVETKCLHSEKVLELLKEIIGWKHVSATDLKDIVHVKVKDISNTPHIEFELTAEEIKVFIDALSYPVIKPREYSITYMDTIIEATKSNGDIIHMIWASNAGGIAIEGVHYQFFLGESELTDFEGLGKTFGFDPHQFRLSRTKVRDIDDILAKYNKYTR